MGFFSCTVFLGLLFIIIGVLIVIKALFKIDIPIFRLIVAFLFVLIGIKILLDGFRPKPETKTASPHTQNIIFSERIIEWDGIRKGYDIVFASGHIHLHNALYLKERTDLKISTIFAASEIQIPAKVPVKIDISSAFGEVNLPNNESTTMGHYEYTSPNFSNRKPYLNLRLDTAFGRTDIIIPKIVDGDKKSNRRKTASSR